MSYLTVKDVAGRFHVPDRTVKQWIENGDLRAFRVSPRLLRIRPQDVPDEPPPCAPRKPRTRTTTLPESGVYMLFLAEELIYVGRSTELPRRITNHRRSGRVFDDVRAIPCEPAVADWLEAELIRTLRPTQNIKRFERRARRIEAAVALL